MTNICSIPSPGCTGGVAILSGDVNFQETNFTSNSASRRGGGLFFEIKKYKLFRILVNDSLIEYNKADKGGGLSVDCNTKVSSQLVMSRKSL